MNRRAGDPAPRGATPAPAVRSDRVRMHIPSSAPVVQNFLEVAARGSATTPSMTALEDTISEDDLIHIATFLAIPDVLRLASTLRLFHTVLMRSRQLWRTAAIDLLGESIVGLHRTAWKEKDVPRFYRRLLRAGLSCDGLAFANKLRRQVVASLPAETPLKSLIRTTGHTATACGPRLVAVIGGWRPDDPTTFLHVFIIDIAGKALRLPALTPASVKPMRRIRHASCAVRTPAWAALPAGAPAALPSVLVLGGACDGGGGENRAEPPPDECVAPHGSNRGRAAARPQHLRLTPGARCVLPLRPHCAESAARRCRAGCSSSRCSPSARPTAARCSGGRRAFP